MRSNQASGFEVASALTLVGLSRTSIGPAISVIERGVAGFRSSDITATAARACTQGWQTARIWRAGADLLEEADQVADVVLDAEAAGLDGHVAGVVPVGDVDVVVAEQHLDRAAQQRREMAGERRGDQHARLGGVDVLGEMQQAAEGQVERDLLGHRHLAVADRHRRDVEARRAWVSS